MKVLTIDVGNTSVDVCIFDGSLKYLGKFPHQRVPRVDADLVLVSSVKPSADELIRNTYPKAEFIGAGDVPVRVAFEGKERIGVDRLLNLFGAVRLYSEDVVVASFGTATVLDLAVGGVFQGGFITPGIASGLECLYQRAELIPEIRLRRLFVSAGTDTESAVVGGLLKQAVYFLKGCVGEWEELYQRRLRLLITGGDGWLFEELGVYEPLLIHRAMLCMFEDFLTHP